MNVARRKDLARALRLLEAVKDSLQEAHSIIEQAAEEEREYYDNMPEGLQAGEKGERASAAADTLEEITSTLGDFDIDDLVSKIEEACE